MKFIYRSLFSLAVILMLFGPVSAQGAGYTVQFGAAPTKEAAEEMVRQLKAKDVSAYIVKSFIPGKGTFYRVRAGVFSSQNEARRFGAGLQQRGVVSEFFIAAYEKPSEETVAGAAPKKQPQAPAKTDQPASNNLPALASRSVTNSATNSANNSTINSAPNPATSPSPNSAPNSAPNSTNNPGLTPSVGGVPTTATPPASGPPNGFLRFQDPKIGYSFDYPAHWNGQPLTDKEASEQRINAGAMFISQKDAAFLQAIWNELDKANNPANENDLIVEVILKSMSSGDGIKLEETARRVENQNGLIKTYLDLKAAFQTQAQSVPLDFLGKAIIVRTSRGIMLVVAFYSKDAPSNAAIAADKIIASARAPE